MRYWVFFVSLVLMLVCGFLVPIVYRLDVPLVVDFLIYATLATTCAMAMIAGYFSGSSILFHWTHHDS